MKKTCLACGKPFYVKPSRLLIGKGKFCSTACYHTSSRKQSTWRIREDGTIEIELTQGQVALIDKDDLDRVSSYKWIAHWCSTTHSFYASRSPRDGDDLPIQLGRFIMGAMSGVEIDHINHDTLDNRKANLRSCTKAENIQNVRIRQNKKTSRYKGVSRPNPGRGWQARIGFGGKIIHLGTFDSEIVAARAYNDAASRLFGEFAYLNQVE